jgi:nicotinate-nucleotide pyrophosphorylase (carboxylating)
MKYKGPQFEEEMNRIITNAHGRSGDGDHSTLACVPSSANGKARLW